MTALVIELENGKILKTPILKPLNIIGSNINADCHIPDLSVPSIAAYIKKTGKKLFISQVNSKSRFFINGKREDLYELHEGDKISIGKVIINL